MIRYDELARAPSRARIKKIQEMLDRRRDRQLDDSEIDESCGCVYEAIGLACPLHAEDVRFNAKTEQALRGAMEGKSLLKSYASLRELFKDLSCS